MPEWLFRDVDEPAMRKLHLRSAVDSSSDSVSNAVKGAATAALTAAMIAGPTIAGIAGPTPAAAAAPLPQVASTIPCAAIAIACVSLSRGEAWLTDGNGRTTYGPVPIAGGTSAYPTPTGTFHVLSKDANFHSTEFHNAPMPYSVFFYPGDAFHADNVHQKSHGCIHLTTADAKAFFNALHVGDLVKILP
ncbi:MAG: L,D-transpeptidase [Pseudonocardiaceae bacterium]